jgi:hypothetical protein
MKRKTSSSARCYLLAAAKSMGHKIKAQGCPASPENWAFWAFFREPSSWSYVQIGEGTHTVFLEKNRMQLFSAVQAFLDETFQSGQ